jgi:ABC-2 type transport system permease protein
MAINLRKVRAILRREYLEHIRRKAFWIFTLLMPLIWIGAICASFFTQSHMAGKKTIVVVDTDGRYFAALKADLESSKDRGMMILLNRRPGPVGMPALERDLTALINTKDRARKIDGFVILDPAAVDSGIVEYRASSISDLGFQQILEHHLSHAILQARLAAGGVSPEVIAEAARPVSLDVKSTNPRAVGFWISYVFMFFLFFTLLQYGMYNMRGVIEEKSTRIVEIVISSVRPTELMLGKIVGIGLVGLTQYGIWCLLAMNFALVAGAVLPASMLAGNALPTVPMFVILYFVLFFLLGYFFYASIYTAIGAPFNSEQEAQQLALIPSWLMAVPMFFWWVIVNNPNSLFSVILSMIPFMTPVVMFMRVTLAEVPPWQIGTSIAIMLFSILGVAWLSGKIYRVGILMYGKKPTLGEILKWMRHGDGTTEEAPAKI